MMKSKATAVWTGSLKDGSGALSTPSHVLESTPYSFKTRFEGSPGTNPEELIAAAHAGCFSMALSNILGEEKITPTKIETIATVTLEKGEAGFAITKVHLDVSAVLRVRRATNLNKQRAKRRRIAQFPSCSMPKSLWTQDWSTQVEPRMNHSLSGLANRPIKTICSVRLSLIR